MQLRTIATRIASCLFAIYVLILLAPNPVYAQDLPPEAYVFGVIGHPQSYKLSCESRSASDWAAYFGVNASEYDILAALPRTDNPETGFVGSPSGDWGMIPPRSYGVHPPPIAKILQTYGLPARDRSGMTWDDLRVEIAAGRPVIIWVVGQMWAGTPISYTASDGQTTTVAQHEHSMILTGYSQSQVTVIDAYTGMDQIYDLNSFLVSWAVLGNRGVILEGEPVARPTVSATAGRTYLVRPGDTLSEIATQFNIDWQTLAELNQMVYPYLVYVDQEIRLPGNALPEEPVQTPEPTPTTNPPPVANYGMYTIQVGDTLVGLADQFNLPWQALVQANEMSYPYFIYPGQQLNLPESSSR